MTRILLFLLICPVFLWAQDSVLTLDVLYKKIKQYHPMARQADLQQAIGDARLLQSRGMFDPKIASNYNSKNFNGTNYFDIWDSKVYVPIWFNTDVKLGYERNQGTYLNSENFTPQDGLLYAGISVPIGKGLFFDPRRLAVRNAALDQQNFEQLRRVQLNDLLLQAANVYWDWYQSWENLKIARNAYTLATQRFNLVSFGAENGAYATIDTVESKIQMQVRFNELQKALIDYQNQSLILQNTLVDPEGNFMSMISEWVPDTVNVDMRPFVGDIPTLINNHPELKILSNTQRQLENDRKWAVESLKPTVDLEYNFLNEQLAAPNEFNLFTNDYKMGVGFEFPLLLRKERGKLQEVNVKQDQTRLKTISKRIDIEVKVENLITKINQTRLIISQTEEMVIAYQTMLEAERSRFENGDSNIFMINTRENKLINAQYKLVSTKAQYGVYLEELQWALGILAD